MASDFNGALALLAAGRLKEAGIAAAELLEHAPDDCRLWRLMSSVQISAGRLDKAVAYIEGAVACAPENPGNLIESGQALARIGSRRAALEIAARTAALRLESAALEDGLGTLFSYCDEPARALTWFTRAVDAAPHVVAYRYNLATAQRMLGDLAMAEMNLNRVIAERPGDYAAYYTRADLRTQTPASNHVDAMLHLLDRGPPGRRAEISLRFALAKELEDLGEYDRSFSHLKRGCDLQRAATKYDVASDVSTIDRIIERHDSAAMQNGGPGFENEECIFVVGLPRSGTTLIERILAAHPAVHGAGELPAFATQAVRQVQKSTAGPVSKLEFVDRALKISPRRLGQDYIAETRPQTGHTPRFVDKTPLNYLYLGLIHRALPKARLVVVRRDPMDCCYAMYKTLFTGAYPFSYDLDELGRYYAAWHRLVCHWQMLLGDSLLVVQYEDLVTEQEMTSRRLVEHCGLEWSESCLNFHENKGAVTTASATQVRRPLYATSIGKWRRYSEHLAGLAHRLDSIATT